MNLLAQKASGKFVTENVHRNCIMYLGSAVEMSPTYKAIKPHLEFVLFSVVMPTLSLSHSDAALFQDDPVEFVRKIHNPLEDWADPRNAAMTLLQNLVKYRQKDSLNMLLTHLQGILAEYTAAPAASKDYLKKDGVIVCLCSVAKDLLESKAHAHMVEAFVIHHVIPEFTSPAPFLRARACWAVEFLASGDVAFQDPGVNSAVLSGLLCGLRDPALPVQAAAFICSSFLPLSLIF